MTSKLNGPHLCADFWPLLSVWTTAQATGPAQRAGRYTPESVQHPARMLPAIAWHAIGAYTKPGDIVLDPMAGVGTTIVEAMHAGRDGIGVEYEAKWAELADANVRLAASQHAPGRGMIIRGDSTQLTSILPAAVHGKAALVVTSPPYGPAVHGQVRPGPGGVAKSHGTYGSADRRRGNLAHQSQGRLLSSFTEILRGSAAMLRPGGVVVVTARPYRVDGSSVDLPGEVETAGIAAGLVPAERCVALLAAVRDQRIVARPSFFQLGAARKAQLAGIPQHLIAHETVCVLVKPQADGRVVAPAALAQGVGR